MSEQDDDSPVSRLRIVTDEEFQQAIAGDVVQLIPPKAGYRIVIDEKTIRQIRYHYEKAD